MGSDPRQLDWHACLNVRDLGGLPTEDGGVTRLGAVVRADTLRALTDVGRAALVDHGIRRIVDLRFADEVEADRLLEEGIDWSVADGEAARPDHGRPVETVHVSLLGDHDAAVDAHLDRVARPEVDEVGSTRAVYLEILRSFHSNVAAAVTAVARTPAGGTLVHCHAGKDRTGLVAALLLLLAGVEVEAVAADYGVSAANLVSVIKPWVDAAPDEAERERRRRIGASPAEAMLAVIDELESCWGGAEEYLLAGGAAPADLDRIRVRLRG